MEKQLLSEVNRVREIMGLVVEQEISKDMSSLRSKLKQTNSKSTNRKTYNDNGHLRIV